jgi:CBS domain-containing protein
VPNRRLDEITVNEIMNKDLTKAEEQTNLNICARLMLDNKISSIKKKQAATAMSIYR